MMISIQTACHWLPMMHDVHCFARSACGSCMLMASSCCAQDFGKSWQNLTQNSQGRIAAFVDFDWGSELYTWGEDENVLIDETIFATAYEDPK